MSGFVITQWTFWFGSGALFGITVMGLLWWRRERIEARTPRVRVDPVEARAVAAALRRLSTRVEGLVAPDEDRSGERAPANV